METRTACRSSCRTSPSMTEAPMALACTSKRLPLRTRPLVSHVHSPIRNEQKG